MFKPQRSHPWCATVYLALACGACAVAAVAAEPRGRGEPGSLTGLRIESAAGETGLALRGRDARRQLVVTGDYSSGQQRDHTRSVQYRVAPEGILSVDAAGRATPLADGSAVVTATDPGGQSATTAVTVTGMTVDSPINFKNQVVPIFTKLG